jgi:hypothetical protein
MILFKEILILAAVTAAFVLGVRSCNHEPKQTGTRYLLPDSPSIVLDSTRLSF